MGELFNGQLNFTDIEAEKYLQLRRAHADRRVNAMDRLTDDVINELIQLCLPHYPIKAGETVQQVRSYTRLETMVRVHLLQVSLNLSDPEIGVIFDERHGGSQLLPRVQHTSFHLRFDDTALPAFH